jgi:hypothetical protein
VKEPFNADGTAVQLRLGPLFDQLENWRRAQAKIPSRSTAVRQLLAQQLALETAHPAADGEAAT